MYRQLAINIPVPSLLYIPSVPPRPLVTPRMIHLEGNPKLEPSHLILPPLYSRPLVTLRTITLKGNPMLTAPIPSRTHIQSIHQRCRNARPLAYRLTHQVVWTLASNKGDLAPSTMGIGPQDSEYAASYGH